MIDEHEIAHWRVDKRIPIALLVTLFLQIAAAIIWATQLNARVGTLEQEVVGTSDFGEKLARIDERLQSVKQDVEFIKREVGSVGNRR
jgi:Tfp pilus assembly protein PilO